MLKRFWNWLMGKNTSYTLTDEDLHRIRTWVDQENRGAKG
jgi:hypothetical protein